MFSEQHPDVKIWVFLFWNAALEQKYFFPSGLSRLQRIEAVMVSNDWKQTINGLEKDHQKKKMRQTIWTRICKDRIRSWKNRPFNALNL